MTQTELRSRLLHTTIFYAVVSPPFFMAVDWLSHDKFRVLNALGFTALLIVFSLVWDVVGFVRRQRKD